MYKADSPLIASPSKGSSDTRERGPFPPSDARGASGRPGADLKRLYRGRKGSDHGSDNELLSFAQHSTPLAPIGGRSPPRPGHGQLPPASGSIQPHNIMNSPGSPDDPSARLLVQSELAPEVTTPLKSKQTTDYMPLPGTPSEIDTSVNSQYAPAGSPLVAIPSSSERTRLSPIKHRGSIQPSPGNHHRTPSSGKSFTVTPFQRQDSVGSTGSGSSAHSLRVDHSSVRRTSMVERVQRAQQGESWGTDPRLAQPQETVLPPVKSNQVRDKYSLVPETDGDLGAETARTELSAVSQVDEDPNAYRYDTDSDGDGEGMIKPIEGQDETREQWKGRLDAFMENKWVSLFMLAATIIALVGSDIQLLLLPKSMDTLVDVVFLIVFLTFIFDILAYSIRRDDYVSSSFFYLDVLAVISLLPDIGFIWWPLMTGVLQIDEDKLIAAQLGLGLAGSFALSMFRVGRLVRMWKMYLVWRDRKERSRREILKIIEDMRTNRDEADDGAVPLPPSTSSEIGRHFSELTTGRVILGLLLVVGVLPLLNPDPSDSSRQQGLDLLNVMIQNRAGPEEMTIAINIYEGQRDGGIRNEGYLLQLKLYGSTYPLPFQAHRDETLGGLRRREILRTKDGASEATHNMHGISQQGALFSLLVTLFIFLLFLLGSLLFTRDANHLMIQPIERMSRMVRRLADNPLADLDEIGADSESESSDDEVLISDMPWMAKAEARKKGEKRRKKREKKRAKKAAQVKDRSFETALIENALGQIGSLLQIGFGEAGAQLIAQNLQSSGAINPMVPGGKINAIFGFCDIRNFNTVIDPFGDRITQFVNTVADIVHSRVKAHGGAPNKNIGDAFLVVYKTSLDEQANLEARREREHKLSKQARRGRSSTKLLDDATFLDRAQMLLQEQENARTYAEGALQAYIEVIQQYQESAAIREFERDPAVQSAVPNYRLSMGFGLHYGWAIEGAIGSSLKIDASYLSPHVNLTARLESATRMYGVSILLSGEFHDHLTPATRARTRLLDIVTVKGSVDPMRLYTVDEVNYPNMPKRTRKTFVKVHANGVKAYINGNWARACDQFARCLNLCPQDVPSKLLLYFMSRYNFVAPSDWSGYRALSSK